MKVLFTGGSGLLGREVRKLRPDWKYPGHEVFDIADPLGLVPVRYNVVIHAAAATSPPKVDEEPLVAAETNIVGTCRMVDLADRCGARLIYISTDYVFPGNAGCYGTDDALYPVNKYAWSKLGGECAVRMYDRGLIVRGSFGPVPFPYDKAFVDSFTSRLPVTEFARRLVEIVERDPPVYEIGRAHV